MENIDLCEMDDRILSSLEQLLIPAHWLWKISSIRIDHDLEEVYVELCFTQDYYKLKGKKVKLYDYRPERKWRHLDFWQYKTYITARVPRVKTATGIMSIPVPWAETNERITELLEKKR